MLYWQDWKSFRPLTLCSVMCPQAYNNHIFYSGSELFSMSSVTEFPWVSLSFPGSLSRPVCPPLFQKSGQASFICLVNCCKAVLQSCWRVNKPFISSSHDFIVPQLTASLVSDLQHECAGEAVLINTSKAETLYCSCYSQQFRIDMAVLFFHLCRRRSLNTWNHLTWRRTWMRLSRRSFPTLNWHWAR